MSVKKINISGNEYDIKDANAQAMISDEFDSGTSYTTGDYCIYENVLYKFTSNKSAGAWDSGKVAATNIDTELSSLNSRIDSRFAWKDLGDVASGDQSVDMSSLGDDDFNEICISVWTGKGAGERDYLCTIPKAGIAATAANAPVVVVGGYYINPNDYGLAMVSVSRQSVSIMSFYHGGQQITGDNRSLRVRYR